MLRVIQEFSYRLLRAWLAKLVAKWIKNIRLEYKTSYEELLTYLIRVEGVLNSRPLTCVYPDQDEPLIYHLI